VGLLELEVRVSLFNRLWRTRYFKCMKSEPD